MNKQGRYVGNTLETDLPVYFHGEISPHAILLGSSGSGKSSYLQRQLLSGSTASNWLNSTTPFSAVVVDPTYELDCTTNWFRRQVGPTYSYDPFKRQFSPWQATNRVRLNVMARLKAGGHDLEALAREDAAVVIRKLGGEKNSYFYDSPRDLWGWL